MKAHCFAVCCLLLCSLCGCVKDSDASAAGRSEFLTVSNQLKQICIRLHEEMGDGDHFPSSFAQLKSRSINRNLFVWPSTGSKPGKMHAVEDWTDFIYVGNNTEMVPDAALVISPPENHGGQHGYLLTVDCRILKVEATRLRQLIAGPWLLATNTPHANIEYLQQEIELRVPRRFTTLYGEAFKK